MSYPISLRSCDSREAQYQLFQRIVETYEQDNDNKGSTTRTLVELMQQVQEYGQPPAEIIQTIAPGLELDEEGVPKLDFANLMMDPENKDCNIL